MRPHLEYAMPACSPNLVADINHLERIQRLATMLVTGIRQLPYEERLQRLGLHSLQRGRLRANQITAFKIFTGLSPSSPLTEISSPIPPQKTARHLLTVPTSICYPDPCFV